MTVFFHAKIGYPRSFSEQSRLSFSLLSDFSVLGNTAGVFTSCYGSMILLESIVVSSLYPIGYRMYGTGGTDCVSLFGEDSGYGYFASGRGGWKASFPWGGRFI